MSEGKIVQIGDARREKRENLKREYERYLFSRILGCYTFIEKLGLKSVEMLDISKTGCGFRGPFEDGHFNVGEEIDLRFYFSQQTYVPTRVTIKRVSEMNDNGGRYWQYGCTFDPSLSTHKALESFVDFVEAYSLVAKEDKGDKQVWFL
jgi:hypothetical protein